jgi:peptidoglycan/xylan/chitin deacetylase (PgdA/CDA1 family)
LLADVPLNHPVWKFPPMLITGKLNVTKPNAESSDKLYAITAKLLNELKRKTKTVCLTFDGYDITEGFPLVTFEVKKTDICKYFVGESIQSNLLDRAII